MNIHIALVGPEPVIITGIRKYSAVDKIYLLYSKTSKVKVGTIKRKLQDFEIKDVVSNEIKSFSFHSTFNTIIEIGKKESTNKNCQFFVNITGGTKIMSAAATLAAYVINAQAYYIMTGSDLAEDSSIIEKIVELPKTNIFYLNPLDSTQIEILRLVDRRGGRVSNEIIRKEIETSAQALSYNIQRLQKKKLINLSIDERDSRKKDVSMTDAGKLAILLSNLKI
jgi:CRISPR locus-related DNA-binding protein